MEEGAGLLDWVQLKRIIVMKNVDLKCAII